MAAAKYPLTSPQFASRLQEGERLLWQGEPDPKLFNRSRLIVYSLLLLPLMPVLVWAFGQKAGTNLPLLSPVTLGIALAVWPLASWAMSKYVGEQTPWAAYALTDRRVMIRRLQRLTSQDSRPKIDEYPLSMLKPNLRLGADGVGTITFGFSPTSYEQAFRVIPDAANVYALLTEARTALAPTDTATPYYLRKADAPPLPAATVDTYLQRGETVLWQGSMDANAYWRSQQAAILALLLLVPAAIGTFLAATGQWTPLWQALAIFPALLLFPLWKAGVLRKVSRTEYVVTNRRVFVLKTVGRGQRTLEERTLAETANMRLVAGKNGSGTIIFERHTHWVWHGQGGSRETYEYSFQHIPDALAVFGLIAAARAGVVKAPPSSTAPRTSV